MKIQLAVYRDDTGLLRVSQYTEPKDAWLHHDEVRVSAIVEVDFPDRPAHEIQTDIEALRTKALAKIRKLEGAAA